MYGLSVFLRFVRFLQIQIIDFQIRPAVASLAVRSTAVDSEYERFTKLEESQRWNTNENDSSTHRLRKR